jgi:hypothetical protein
VPGIEGYQSFAPVGAHPEQPDCSAPRRACAHAVAGIHSCGRWRPVFRFERIRHVYNALLRFGAYGRGHRVRTGGTGRSRGGCGPWLPSAEAVAPAQGPQGGSSGEGKRRVGLCI